MKKGDNFFLRRNFGFRSPLSLWGDGGAAPLSPTLTPQTILEFSLDSLISPQQNEPP